MMHHVKKKVDFTWRKLYIFEFDRCALLAKQEYTPVPLHSPHDVARASSPAPPKVSEAHATGLI